MSSAPDDVLHLLRKRGRDPDRSALASLSFLPGIRLIASSSFVETAPVGPPQPLYLNAAATLRDAEQNV